MDLVLCSKAPGGSALFLILIATWVLPVVVALFGAVAVLVIALSRRSTPAESQPEGREPHATQGRHEARRGRSQAAGERWCVGCDKLHRVPTHLLQRPTCCVDCGAALSQGPRNLSH